jgi:hypothetical protein
MKVLTYKTCLLTLILLVIATNNYAQKKPQKGSNQPQLKEMFEDAAFFYESGDYREALYNYLKLHEALPENNNINFQIGMCYMNIPGEEVKSVPYLEKAAANINFKYKSNTLEEKRAPLHALYYLGNAYRINNQLTEALNVYNKFRNNPKFENTYNSQMVDNEIDACSRAKIIQDLPVDIKVAPLPSSINTTGTNNHAITNTEGSVLLYVSELKFYNAIFVSYKTDTGWSSPQNINPQVGNDGECYPTCLSSDGKELYIVKQQKGNNDLYVSVRNENNKWGIMKPLNKNINSAKNESAATISADGKMLIFSSDRRGGEGNLDLYLSRKDENGEWEKPSNLGDMVNTPSNETSPVLCNDDKVLYFSSEGHFNMGGYDVFTTAMIGDNKWDVPVNAGYPVCTTGNDLYYYPFSKGTKAFNCLTKEEGVGKEDIYEIENHTVEKILQSEKNPQKILVKDEYTKKIIGGLYVNDEEAKKKVLSSLQKLSLTINNSK